MEEPSSRVVPNTSIHSESSGRGTPILFFVHAWCADSTDWRYQRAHFEASHQVHTCDLRGHGASKKIVDGLDVQSAGSDVAGLLARDAQSPVVLIGHGLGCRVVLEAAQRIPNTIVGVILIDGNRLATGDADLAVRAGRKRYAATGFGKFRDSLVEGMFSNGASSAHKADVVARARSVTESVAEAYWCNMLRWDAAALEGALKSLQAPLLVLQSTYLTAKYQHFATDPRMVTPLLDVIGRLVPTVRIQIIDAVGHFPMLDAADAVNRCITTFLADATFRRFFEST
jgi:pimeloyl-ACP methyl ester carboxylesterase